MKICILSNLYPPYVSGGAEIVAQTMAEGLARAGHEVRVLSASPFQSFGSLRPLQDNTGKIVRVYRFFPLNIYFYLAGPSMPSVIRALWHVWDLINPHTYFVVRSWLRRERPDVVITHNLMGLGFTAILAIGAARVKHVHLLHDVQLYNPSGIILKGKEYSASQRLYTLFGYVDYMRHLFRDVPQVISPSRFLLDFYQQHGFFLKSKSTVIPNPIAQSSAGIVTATSPLKLLYVGTVSEPKGVKLLLEAIHTISEVPIECVVVGKADKKFIETLPNDSRVTFAGWQDRSSLEKYFANADVLVVPTMCYDNSPTVVGEALSRGIAVLASDIGGASEIVHNGVNGWIFEAGSTVALQTILKQLATQPSLITEASRNAKQSVAPYTTEKYIEKLENFIEI